MEFIAEKSGESPAFRTLLPRVCRQFGGQFEIVTVDAGMTCGEDALAIRGQGKDFVMTLKGNQPKLHQLVVPLLESAAEAPRVCADELRNGALVFRELYTIKVEDMPEEVRFPGAKEVWCVRQLAQPVEGTSAKPTMEVKFFLSVSSERASSSFDLSLTTSIQQLIAIALAPR